MDGLSPQVTLRRGVAILDAIGPASIQPRKLKWWIGVGTALGYCRGQGFVAGDTDIDVRIALDYRDLATAADLAAHVVHTFEAEGFKLFRETYWDRRPMQSCFKDARNNNVVFDIYYFYEGLTEGHYVNVNNQSLREKPAHLVESCRAMPWPNHPDIIVNVPHPIEEYCAWRFGPDWRIPKRKDELTNADRPCFKPVPEGTVLTYGTFDLFHVGHTRLLRRAAALGERLVVGVVSDALCRQKGKRIINSEAHRAEVVAALDCVDRVFVQVEMDQKEKDIERFDARCLVVGDDWRGHPRFEQVRGYRGVKIVYLNRTEGISSSMLRESLLGSTDRAVQRAHASEAV